MLCVCSCPDGWIPYYLNLHCARIWQAIEWGGVLVKRTQSIDRRPSPREGASIEAATFSTTLLFAAATFTPRASAPRGGRGSSALQLEHAPLSPRALQARTHAGRHRTHARAASGSRSAPPSASTPLIRAARPHRRCRRTQRREDRAMITPVRPMFSASSPAATSSLLVSGRASPTPTSAASSSLGARCRAHL